MSHPTANPDPRRQARRGVMFALAAYLFWGLVPGYFKLLPDVGPAQILAHRVIWSVLLLTILIARKKMWGEVRRVFTSPPALRALCMSTLLIATNWFTFIYAVSKSWIVLTSLGYYMNPLIAVLLGMILLKERMRALQWVCVVLAAGAVTILTISQGAFPVIPLILATSFALYGLIRKTAPAGPLVGLFVETALLFPIAIAVAIFGPVFHWSGVMSVSADVLWHRAPLLIFSGVVTALPLLWFASAARLLKLSTLGLLQYISPTCAFLLAVLVFREPFTHAQRIAFPMIWIALVIFSIDSIRAFRRGAPAKSVPHPEEGLLSEV